MAGDDVQQRQAVKDLAEAEARRDDAAGLFASGEITRKEWFLIRDGVGQRINAARRVLDRTAGPLADLPASETALRKAWEEGSVAWRRALLGAVVDRIVIAPSAGRANRFDPDRVTIVWRV